MVFRSGPCFASIFELSAGHRLHGELTDELIGCGGLPARFLCIECDHGSSFCIYNSLLISSFFSVSFGFFCVTYFGPVGNTSSSPLVIVRAEARLSLCRLQLVSGK